MTAAALSLTLLEEAEAALSGNDPERAAELLAQADRAGVPDEGVARFVDAMVHANRMVWRQTETLAWIEKRLEQAHSPATHATLLRARIEALRSIDTRRALDLADEALAAAEAVGDDVAYAVVLSHAAFAAYRRGEVREAQRFATLAGSRSFKHPAANIAALRARMLAATASGQLEHALDLSLEVRDLALAMGNVAQAAVECNNIAEAQLKMGRPLTALEAATRAAELAARAAFRPAEAFSRVLVGVAMCENGDLATGISQLRRVDTRLGSPVLRTDALAALSFWLVERDAEGDARDALVAAEQAAKQARDVGLRHYLTTLMCTVARAYARLGDEARARAALEQARAAFDAGDVLSERHLAIAMGEVHPPGDATRRTALASARTHLLREAGARDDALAYCTGVRVHRRLLEMTGGVPLDLPRSR
jgi:tetratricopeptide (TPR) repeat protein